MSLPSTRQIIQIKIDQLEEKRRVIEERLDTLRLLLEDEEEDEEDAVGLLQEPAETEEEDTQPYRAPQIVERAVTVKSRVMKEHTFVDDHGRTVKSVEEWID